MSMSKHIRAVVAVAVSSVAVGLAAAPAYADFGFSSIGMQTNGLDGTFSRQAGGHPDLEFDFSFNTKLDASNPTNPQVIPDGNVRDIDVALPAGATGNPTAAPTCTEAQLTSSVFGGFFAACPVSSQVGYVQVQTGPQPNPPREVVHAGVYNMQHGDDVPGEFAFLFANTVVTIIPSVNGGSYTISASSSALSEAEPIFHVHLIMWGIPADPLHDVDRIDTNPSSGPKFGIASPDERRPFLTAPTYCPGTPLTTVVTADSWQDPGVFVSADLTQDFEGTPFVIGGCDKLAFNPSIDVKPLSRGVDSPTGLDVDVTVPQSDNPDGLATAQVRKTVVTFPAGMSVSPSSAAGLGACSPAQIGLGSNDVPSCPDSSKIGTVEIDTPLLADPLEGDVILASQDDNPFHSLLALYLVARGPGFIVKLPGRVDTDPVTGQVTTTFDNTPQLPFSRLHVVIRGGSQAPLATPAACGTYMTHTSITSWASDAPVELDSPMTIDQGCVTPPFAPSLSAGSVSTLAGARSPFSLTLTRTDGQPYLSGVSATLPSGLLANIASVPQCAEALAAAGTCPPASQIGHTSALSGPGDAPLALTGSVSLTGPYGGAPFGLSIVVPTAGQVGPFDLGNVVVRAGIFIDPVDAHATVMTDPLPTIIDGFPLRLRQVGVSIDRSSFMVNPTSCAEKQVGVLVTAVGGASSSPSVPYQVGGCAGLAFKPKFTAAASAKTSRADGASFSVKLAYPPNSSAQANVASVRVDLPKQLPSRLTTLQKACKASVFAANPASCPAASVVGNATVSTPLLAAPLSGPAYFVSHGSEAFPSLTIVLQGNGVTVDLVGSTFISKAGITSTTFKGVPDVPVSTFSLALPQGRYSALTANGISAIASW
jgi:hypothetical protein